MMPPSRRARFWRVVGILSFVGLTASYVWYSRSVPFTHGGSTMGIFYGVVATFLVLMLAYFGIRKRSYQSTWGTLDGWLQGHLYLGLLVPVVVVYHAGFRFRDMVATTTGVVLLIVVLSGIWGTLFYAALPRRLTRIQSSLTVEEISAQLNQTAQAMNRLAAGRSVLFQRIADQILKKIRPRSFAGWRLLVASGRVIEEDGSYWQSLLDQLGEDERPSMRQLLVLFRQHRELHLRLRFQQRYRNLLEAWLYMHVPLSILLIVLLTVHVVAAFYFGAV